MKKVLISRYGAYGDIIHCSHLPHLLKEKGFDVIDFETNHKGIQILHNNPYINKIIPFYPDKSWSTFSSKRMMELHWKNISEGYDKFINLYNSLEHAIIAMEDDVEYYMHSNARKHMKEINFYDQTSIWAGYPEEVGKWSGELFFDKEDENIVKLWMSKFSDKYIVMLNLSGTTIHKRLVKAKEIAVFILENIKDSHIITTGDNNCVDFDLTGDRITSIVDKFPFMQAVNICKYINLLVSMESGLAVASNALGTPTIQIMTSSSLNNHPKYAKNDYSFQSPVYCSPCSKGPYRFIGCPHKGGFPLCVDIPLDLIKEKIIKVYENSKNHKWISAENRIPRADAPRMSIL